MQRKGLEKKSTKDDNDLVGFAVPDISSGSSPFVKNQELGNRC